MENSEYHGPTRDDVDHAIGFHVAAHYEPMVNKSICRRWRVNGQMKTWKRNPPRFELPVKFGLYAYDTITASHIDDRTIFAFRNDKDNICPFCGSRFF